MRKQKVRRRPGDVVAIPLGDGHYGFARVLKDVMAFYHVKSDSILPIAEIVSRPILFKIWVMDHAVTSGRWPVKWDDIAKKLYITYDGSQEIPATRSECEGLERAAVWEPEHVESRLRDHFAGRKNIWVDSLRLAN
jgi:hypothetical protein